jgi:hypothetical protein
VAPPPYSNMVEKKRQTDCGLAFRAILGLHYMISDFFFFSQEGRFGISSYFFRSGDTFWKVQVGTAVVKEGTPCGRKI